MGKGLLVIDMQNVCVGKNHSTYFKYDLERLISSVNKRIVDYDKSKVIYIVNIMKNNLINKLAPFKSYDGTENAELANELVVVSNNIFKKYTGNAFENKELNSYLKVMGIDEVEVIGVDGGACVARTALGAIENGYKVNLNTECIGIMFKKKADKFNKRLKSMGATFN